MKKISIVTTTINIPEFLVGIFENAIRYERGIYSVYVIADMKTPGNARQVCMTMEEKYNFKVHYLDIDEQKEALASFPELFNLFPLNDGSRKMIGTVLAYMDGCDALVMIDDDNFATHHDFVGYHGEVGNKSESCHVDASNGWFNVSEVMIEKSGVPFYPRGYPWSERFKALSFNVSQKKSKTVVNQGLVLGDPDIDAVSRLFWPIEVIAIDSKYEPQFKLEPGTWSPFNDQNTALSRDIIPVYFKPPSAGRNADIWTSYVVSKLAEHFGDVISFGQPLVKQIRNIHDLREDYKIEELHNKATDQFVNILKSISLTSKTYISCLKELLEKFLKVLDDDGCQPKIGTQEGRHHQLPGKDKLEKSVLDQTNMMKNFLKEYLQWANLMEGVISYNKDKVH